MFILTIRFFSEITSSRDSFYIDIYIYMERKQFLMLEILVNETCKAVCLELLLLNQLLKEADGNVQIALVRRLNFHVGTVKRGRREMRYFSTATCRTTSSIKHTLSNDRLRSTDQFSHEENDNVIV